ASTPIIQPPVTPAQNAVVPRAPVSSSAVLTPEAVGRSAWDSELASVGQSDPEGWDKLSWQDLDEKRSSGHSPLREQTSFGRLLREWGPVLFAAVVIALFVRLVLVQAYHIPSASMVPTLEEGDRVVVNRLSYQFGEVERGQVVVFKKPQGSSGQNDLIKRIIGLPGETIRFADNQVYVNGLRLEEPYLAEQDSTRPRLTIPGCAQATPAPDTCVVPEGAIFMMGDNRLGSSDSRVFGPIEIDNVVGRAFLRVWPLNNLGEL
ncbi:signal peptidase I, partial [Acidimicrobiales bacterium]|nr:signal peptidase I [Acidimicrobiales bacterium]